MAIDEIKEEKHECPCGKGTYTVKYLLGDFPDLKINLAMDCDKCKKTHKLEMGYDYKGFQKIEKYKWVKVETV
jgi:hypothetical protein